MLRYLDKLRFLKRFSFLKGRRSSSPKLRNADSTMGPLGPGKSITAGAASVKTWLNPFSLPRPQWFHQGPQSSMRWPVTGKTREACRTWFWRRESASLPRESREREKDREHFKLLFLIAHIQTYLPISIQASEQLNESMRACLIFVSLKVHSFILSTKGGKP